MRITTLAGLALTAPCAWISANPQDGRDAYVMLMVSEPGPRGIALQSEFSKQAKPGAGKELKLRIESGCQCKAVIVNFNSQGRTAPDRLPAEIVVKEHSVNQFPPPGGGSWTWEGPGNFGEIDVIFISGDPPDTRELSKLLGAMKETPAAEALRRKQDAELRRWIDAHAQNPSVAADYTVKPSPEIIGGMVRGEECAWCKAAQRVSIPVNGFAIVRIHID